MAETDAMTIDERRKYLHKIWGRYRDSDKKGKSQLLDEVEKITGQHRKSILRILNGRLSRKKRKTERGKGYEARVGDAVRLIAKSLDYPCAERLKKNLVRYSPEYIKERKLLRQLCYGKLLWFS